MGVYIKGMEMPTEFDPDVYIELACGIDRKRYARLYNFHQGGLTDWCEVVPVPPHGRLKDADALKDYMIEALNEALPDCRSEKQRTELRETTLAFMQDIDECPTIIPASEETED